jgi:hypothetical protein
MNSSNAIATKSAKTGWKKKVLASSLVLSILLLPLSQAKAATDPITALINSFTQVYQSYYNGIKGYVQGFYQNLTAGTMGIYDPNVARQNAADTGQAPNLFEQSNVDHTISRGIAEGNLSNEAQSATKTEIDNTNFAVSTGANDSNKVDGYVAAGQTATTNNDAYLTAANTANASVTSLSDQATNATASQDILRYMAQQNAALSEQQNQGIKMTQNQSTIAQQMLNSMGAQSNQSQQILTILGASHIHDVIQQATSGVIAAEAANTSAALGTINQNNEIGRTSSGIDGVAVAAQATLIP